jgi:hypothetical protein
LGLSTFLGLSVKLGLLPTLIPWSEVLNSETEGAADVGMASGGKASWAGDVAVACTSSGLGEN